MILAAIYTIVIVSLLIYWGVDYRSEFWTYSKRQFNAGKKRTERVFATIKNKLDFKGLNDRLFKQDLRTADRAKYVVKLSGAQALLRSIKAVLF